MMFLQFWCSEMSAEPGHLACGHGLQRHIQQQNKLPPLVWWCLWSQARNLVNRSLKFCLWSKEFRPGSYSSSVIEPRIWNWSICALAGGESKGANERPEAARSEVWALHRGLAALTLNSCLLCRSVWGRALAPVGDPAQPGQGRREAPKLRDVLSSGKPNLPLCEAPQFHRRLLNVESCGVFSSHVADRNSPPASESPEAPQHPEQHRAGPLLLSFLWVSHAGNFNN